MLDIARTGVEAVIAAVAGGREQVLLRDAGRAIRLDVRSGTLSDGPVRLRYALEGFARLESQLLTLRRLLGLVRLRRMPTALFAPELRSGRWIALLRTLDALEAGASQREIATALFGAAAVERDWRSETDYLRLRVQRLARQGRALASGGYRHLLKAAR